MDRKTYLNGGERDGMHQAGSVLREVQRNMLSGGDKSSRMHEGREELADGCG